MPNGIYSEAAFERIADVLGIDAGLVKHHANFFEAAAFRLTV
jgi:hypothetical protein